VNIANLTNSIKSIVWDVRHDMIRPEDATKQIVMIMLVELWPYQSGQVIYLDNLTDSEYRICSMWAIENKGSYSSRIQCIKDMREVFPGLSLSAANHFCK
jgi:hypothetical protein